MCSSIDMLWMSNHCDNMDVLWFKDITVLTGGELAVFEVPRHCCCS
jgi:hypothetical protein